MMSERLIKGASCHACTIGNAALHKEICILLRRFSFHFALIMKAELLYEENMARCDLTPIHKNMPKKVFFAYIFLHLVYFLLLFSCQNDNINMKH